METCVTSGWMFTRGRVGQARAAIGGSIRPAGGPEYFIDTRYLQVGETVIYDIRELRDKQIPDPKGIKIPKEATTGQFDWTTIFGDGSQRLIGRNEITDRSNGLSASFSCGGICNCPWSTRSAFVTPGNPNVDPGGIASLIAQGTSTPTCSSSSPPTNFTIYPAPWNIAVPGHFTLTSGQASSSMHGTSGGSSSFYTPFNGTDYAWNGQSGACILNGTPPLNPGGNGNVTVASIALVTAPTPIPADDAARGAYTTLLGTSNLGKIIDQTGVQEGCNVGYQTVGFISPSVYTGHVILHRTILGFAIFSNASQTTSGGSSDDTSVAQFRDDDPQSGGSAGKVYDLDAPRMQPAGVDGKTYRLRVNFYAYAALTNGTPISPNYYFNTRISCTKTSFGYQFVDDVTGDNQVATGTIPLTWNIH